MDSLVGWVILAMVGGGIALSLALGARRARREAENPQLEGSEVPGRERLLDSASAFDAGEGDEPARRPGRRADGTFERSAAGVEAGQVEAFEPMSFGDMAPLFRDAHHLAILGASGDGKTMAGQALLLILRGKATIIDPYASPGKWGGLRSVTTLNDGSEPWEDVESMLEHLDEELARRGSLARSGGHEPPRLNILWDEVNLAVEQIGSGFVGEKLRRWVRTMRQFDMHLILYLQSDRVAALGLEGHGDARKNLLWLYIGDDARRLAKQLHRNKEIDRGVLDGVMELEYPGVIKWHEEFYAVDMGDIPKLLDPHSKVTVSEYQPKPVAVSRETGNQKRVEGVDDVDVFTALARVLDGGLVSSETRLLEIAFQCGSGSSRRYQSARERLQAARSAAPEQPTTEPEE